MTRAAKNWTVFSLAIVLVVFAATGTTHRLVKSSKAYYDRNDFSIYYRWGADHNHGRDVWTDPPGSQIQPGHNWYHCNYTPFFVLGFAPLARLDLKEAYNIWQGIQITSLMLALFLCTRAMRPAPSGSLTAIFIALMLLSVPVFEMIRWGQATGILALAVAITLLGTQNNDSLIAGLGVATATLLKLYPGIMIVFFVLRRRWLVVLWSALFFTFGFLLSGVHNWFDFFNRGLVVVLTPFIREEASVLGTVWAWLSPHGNHTIPPGTEILTVTAIVDAVVFLACMMATIVTPNDELGSGLAFSLWIAAGVLLSPLALSHDLILFAPLTLFATRVCYEIWSNPSRHFNLSYIGGTGALFVGLLMGAHRPSSVAAFWIGAFIFAGSLFTLKARVDARRIPA